MLARGGTALVTDIDPGPGGSLLDALCDDGVSPGCFLPPPQFTTASGAVYFSADDGTHGAELWTTDGTGAGTILAADLNPSGDGNVWSPVTLGGTLYFFADDGLHGTELMAFD